MSRKKIELVTCDCCSQPANETMGIGFMRFFFARGFQTKTEGWDLCNRCAESIGNAIQQTVTRLREERKKDGR